VVGFYKHWALSFSATAQQANQRYTTMTLDSMQEHLGWAVEAAQSAGQLIRKNWHSPKRINAQEQHDIKLELDVRCQKRIEQYLTKRSPHIAILGEEDTEAPASTEYRWVVDPIDGTVNFSYGIPHACVSIALQTRFENRPKVKNGHSPKPTPDGYSTLLGVVYDPFCDDLWTGIVGQKARANGRVIHVSDHKRLDECIVSIGFAKSEASLRRTLPYFNKLAPEVRKIRIMGAAALALTYVAHGRFDAYVEGGVRLWDIAAGGLIVECAGGEFHHEAIDAKNHVYSLVANNGLIRPALTALGRLPSNPS